MSKKRKTSRFSSGISRRRFLQMAGAAGLLAGCRVIEPFSVPPVADKNSDQLASRVVHTHHAGVWQGDTLSPAALRQMLDASITQLTGMNDAGQAWALLFAPNERIGIKVNTIEESSFWTHVPLVMMVTECLQEVGVPPEQITIFDRWTYELEAAGYPVNEDGPGVRCYGSDVSYTGGWTLLGDEVRVSDILLDCDALINMPLLKQHDMSGVTFALKNHYGSFDKPGLFHRGRIEQAIPALNALPPITERTRLIIGDALKIIKPNWYQAVSGDSILLSFDPVAHDTVGLQLLTEVWAAESLNSTAATELATPWLENAAALGLGTNNLIHLELVELTLG